MSGVSFQGSVILLGESASSLVTVRMSEEGQYSDSITEDRDIPLSGREISCIVQDGKIMAPIMKSVKRGIQWGARGYDGKKWSCTLSPVIDEYFSCAIL